MKQKFLLTAPLSTFPSDNTLDAMGRKARIAIKDTIKMEAFILARAWLIRNNIKPSSLSKKNPYFTRKAETVLRIYLKEGNTLDVSNLSIKHFLDQLVTMGIIVDDSVSYLPTSIATFGGFVKGKGFAEFEINEIDVMEVF